MKAANLLSGDFQYEIDATVAKKREKERRREGGREIGRAKKLIY